MLPKKLAAAALVLALLALTGCAGEFVTDLYVQDVLAVNSGEEENLMTSGSIIIESPGDEYNDTLKSLLQEYFREVKNFRKGSGDLSSKVIVDVKIPVITFESSWADPWLEDPMAIVVMPLDDGMAAFGLMLNGWIIDDLFARFTEEAFFTLSVQDFEFVIKLMNDLRGPITAYVQGVYANGRPMPYEELLELERRDTLELRLGDVARDYAYEEGYVFLGVLEPLE